MKIFRKLQFSAEDLRQTVCNHKWLALVCTLVAAVGITIGAIFVNIFEYSWWYDNRIDCAIRLFDGGFGLIFSFLLWAAVYYACLLCCQLTPHTKYLCCAALFVACFYCGANTAATVICWSLWGILFAILVTVVEVLGLLLSCFAACCQAACTRTLREAFCDTKASFYILACAFAVKIFTFFVILRLLTAVI